MTSHEPHTASAYPEFLRGHTFTFGGHRYRLDRLLGSGLTAIVFLGEPSNGGDTAGQEPLAFKFAKDEDRFRTALNQEWKNLKALEQAESKSRTHYFPRAPKPITTLELPPELVLPGQAASLLVLGQEVVSGRSVDTLLLDYPPGLRLPERLALEIARQYAEMLTILHGANLTCADRKLADLYWQADTGERSGYSGRLMIVDWNVTAEANPGEGGTVALDLFRFGLLWHRMLLGVEPRFRRAAGWQLEEPLQKHPIWQSLSIGTGDILARLLHPAVGERYRSADLLLRDLEKQVKLWGTKASELDRGIKSVYELYIEAPGNPPSPEEIKAAKAAVDVLRVREGLSPTMDKARRALLRAAREAPFFQLQAAMSKVQWRKAREEAARLQNIWHDPAVLLQVERYAAIAAQAERAKSSRSEVQPLLAQSDQIFRIDAPDPESSSEESSERTVLAQDDAGNDDAWMSIRDWFSKELAYRRQITEARKLRDNFDYREAHRVFSHILLLRKWLRDIHPTAISWTDQLYGDPTDESTKVDSIVSAGNNVESAFRRALETLRDGKSLLPEVREGIIAALRCEPDNPFLSRLDRLLEVEDRYRDALRLSEPLLEEYTLEQVTEAWNDLSSPKCRSTAQAVVYTDLEATLQFFLTAFEELLKRRGKDFANRRELKSHHRIEISRLFDEYANAT